MSTPTLSPAAREIEKQFAEPACNPLQDQIQQIAIRQLEQKGVSPSAYDINLVRRNALAGNEVLGPKTIHAGHYPETILYGAAGSPVLRFRSAIVALKMRAEAAAKLSPEAVEYGQAVALLWAEVGRLKQFLGVSPAISEIVAELRTARFQFIGNDTPLPAVQAMAHALKLIAEASRLDHVIVDRAVEKLEAGGIDSLAPDALRAAHG